MEMKMEYVGTWVCAPLKDLLSIISKCGWKHFYFKVFLVIYCIVNVKVIDEDGICWKLSVSSIISNYFWKSLDVMVSHVIKAQTGMSKSLT